MTVLYPFMEDGFSENTPTFIQTLSFLQRSKAIDMLITVDKAGRTTEALKKARLPHEVIGFAKPVGLRDFYPVALFKLIRSSLSTFFYFKEHKISVMHCPDVLSLLNWGNTSKMNRVPFITSIQENVRFSHYTRLMLADSRKLICLNETVRAAIPSRFSSVALLAPQSQDVPENQNPETAQKHIIDFWIQLYASLFIKPDLSKITGILNKY